MKRNILNLTAINCKSIIIERNFTIARICLHLQSFANSACPAALVYGRVLGIYLTLGRTRLQWWEGAIFFLKCFLSMWGWGKNSSFDVVLYFLQFSSTACRNSPILTFYKHSGLIFTNFRYFLTFQENREIQDGGSKDAITVSS